MRYYSIHEFSKIINRTPQTLRNWDKKGRLKPDHFGGNGYRYYSEAQLREVLGKQGNANKYVIGYCRVSSNKQKAALECQIENLRTYLMAQDKPFEIITDVGSGINYNKRGLKELISKITKNGVEKVVVLHKDRLLGFGYELIEYIAELYDCRIEVVYTTEKMEEEELLQDLVQIMTVFSCRLQGKKADKTKSLIKELINNNI